MNTWTPKTQQTETWTVESQDVVRVFDPFVFDRRPVFDTGTSAGVWDEKTIQAETWTTE